MEQSLINKIKEGLSLDGLDPKSYSPLSAPTSEMQSMRL